MTRTATSTVLSALCAALVLAGAALLPLSPDGRAAAVLGAALSGAAGPLGVLLKRRALMRPGIAPALRAVGLVFAVRLLLAAQGLFLVARARSGELCFVVAFFAVYALQQLVELSEGVTAS